MAETKTTPPTSAPQGQKAGGTKTKLSKMEAVQRALTTLGADAKPLELQSHIKSSYGIAMSTDHISTYKGDIARKKAKAAAKAAGSARRRRPPGHRRPRRLTTPPKARTASFWRTC